MTAWRGEQCPARGAGLSHAAFGPGESHCTFCNFKVNDVPPQGVPATASEVQVTVTDHLYIMTLTGRCARAGCGQPKEAHSMDDPMPPLGGDCKADHQYVKAWAACDICHVIHEPMLAKGELLGRSDGKGRLPWTERQLDRMEMIFRAWIGGFFKS